MKPKCFSLIFPVLLFIGPFNIAQTQRAPEKAAQQAAESWLRLMDSHKYGQAWDEASQYLKARISKRDWEARLSDSANRLEEFSDMKSRQLVNAEVVKLLPDIPNQGGVALVYESSFKGSTTIRETIELILEKDEEWRVATYLASRMTPVYATPLLAPHRQPPGAVVSESQMKTTVDKEPILLNDPKPSYTDAARKNGVEGIVEAQVFVDITGTVTRIKLIRVLADGLAVEAIKTIQMQRYRPAIKNGKPVGYWMKVGIEFKLENK